MKSIVLAGTAVLLTLAIGGCASAPQQQGATATHYWESNVSSRQYHRDHSACEHQTLVDADAALDPDSTSFSAYRDCMIEHGYTLRTY